MKTIISQKTVVYKIICQRGLHGANKKLDSLIRVNHAGELGADRIYAGQMAVLGVLIKSIMNCPKLQIYLSLLLLRIFLFIGNSSVGPKIKHMWEQEKVHRNTFEQLINQRRARPSFLFPLWHCAGYVLGAGKFFMKG